MVLGGIIGTIAGGSDESAIYIGIGAIGIIASVIMGIFLSAFGELVESAFEIKQDVQQMKMSHMVNNGFQPNMMNNMQQPMYYNNAPMNNANMNSMNANVAPETANK